MGIRKLFCFLCFSIAIGNPIFAQQLLKGSIRDVQSDAPVAFASIGIKNKSIGVISNLEGDFQVPMTYQTQGDTIIISCIGYDQMTLPLSSLLKGQINIIKLKKADYILPEAVVRSKKRRKLSAIALVRRAIKSIPDNYPSSPFSYIGYYRDYQKKEDQYLNLNEAILAVYDQGFQTDDRVSTQIKLYDYQPNSDFSVDTTTSIAYDNTIEKFVPNASITPFGGNELSILMMHDAIRNSNVHSYSFADTFSLNFVKHHKFRLAKPTTNGDLILHCVEFEGQYPYVPAKFSVEGKLYIEQGSYAIHKMNYSVLLEKDSTKQMIYEIQLEYSKTAGLMYLNYISFNNLFYLAKPPLFRVVETGFDTSRSSNAQLTSIINRRTSIDIRLNKPAERTSALNKENYTISLKQKNLDIAMVNLGGGNSIRIYFKDSPEIEKLKNEPGKWLPFLTIEYGAIYDKENNKLNEPEYVAVRQFREFFRQKVTEYPSTPLLPSLFIRKDTTLSANFIQLERPENLSDYWMNTPLKY
ncbi:MAG: carboxypeptidase-like regulatory domain-containing protein [Saprospiraceae bacterium]